MASVFSGLNIVVHKLIIKCISLKLEIVASKQTNESELNVSKVDLLLFVPGFVPKNMGTKQIYVISEAEENAIKTVKYVCWWYLLCMGTAATLHVAVWVLFDLSSTVKALADHSADFLNIINSSFNLLFYLRGYSFRQGFKQRWENLANLMRI